MKVEVEEISPTRRRIAVEIPADRVASEFERAVRSVSQNARIKGFRPGRVPRPVLERFFGEEIRSRVATSLVREGFSSAVADSKLDIVSQPELDIESLHDNQAMRFSATVDVRPALGPIDVSGISVERPVLAVGEDQVDRVLEQLRLRHAELVPIEDRKDVARGDFATVQIAVEKDGEALPALSVESASVEVGGGSLPQAVDERLALARVGETFTVEGPAPEGVGPELADKTLRYTVTVRSLAERRLPDLDDEFAKDHGDCETLAELRTRIRGQLEQDAARRAEAAVRDRVLDDLLARQAIDPPLSLVQRRVEDLLHDFKHELAQRGLQLASDEHETEAREKLQARAERDVRIGLLLDALAAQLEVEITDDELADRIGKLLNAAGRHRERLREHYAEEHARDALRSEMRRAKALEKLVAGAAIQDGGRTPA
ncbi:MAG TPA: trigger factor [Candidatus Binatia bacterium]|nr:trigger factor [Candidatus Binatia bacterium]